jgi:hypothetical protein
VASEAERPREVILMPARPLAILAAAMWLTSSDVAILNDASAGNTP